MSVRQILGSTNLRAPYAEKVLLRALQNGIYEHYVKTILERVAFI